MTSPFKPGPSDADLHDPEVFDHDAYDVQQDWPEVDAAPLTDDGELPPLADYIMALLVERGRQAPRRPNSADWMNAELSKEQGGTCAYCGTDVVRGQAGTDDARRAILDLLIPLESHGTLAAANRVLACNACANRKRGQEWLTFGLAVNRGTLLAQRREALMSSGNHVLPLSVKGMPAAMSALGERWRYPRFPVLAQVFENVGYLGWDALHLANERGGELKAMLRFEFGGRDRSNLRFALFEIPLSRWYDAAWAMIDQNALLERPTMSARALQAYPPHVPGQRDQEHQERWWLVLPGDRWVQEARRVARWSVQAKPGQEAFKAQRREALRQKPYADARERMVQRLESIRSGVVPSGEARVERATPVVPATDVARPLSPSLRSMFDEHVQRQNALLAALREGRPVPPVGDAPRVRIAPAELPVRKPLPADHQARLDAAKTRMSAMTHASMKGEQP